MKAAMRLATALLVIGAAGPASAADAFRVTALELRDPHFYTNYLIGCSDVTNTALGGNGFNQRIAADLSNDGNGDGFLDLGLVLVFDALDPAPGASGTVRFGAVECTAPSGSSACQLSPGYTLTSFSYLNSNAGNCLEPLPGTTYASYNPQVTVTSPPCFATGTGSLTLILAQIPFALQDVQIAARYEGSPVQLQTGLLRGFMPVTVAANTIVPANVAIIGGKSLASLLPGGTDNCLSRSDLDIGPDGQTSGWWFYFNFIAEAVPFEEPATSVLAPAQTMLGNAFPNPFNPSVTIPYALAAADPSLRVAVYDARGGRVASLRADTSVGAHTAHWDGRNTDGRAAPSGVYFVRLESAGSTDTRKIVLLK